MILVCGSAWDQGGGRVWACVGQSGHPSGCQRACFCELSLEPVVTACRFPDELVSSRKPLTRVHSVCDRAVIVPL